MIWIFHQRIADAASVESYDELHTLIKEKEQLKSTGPLWSFTVFTPRQVATLYAHTPPFRLTEAVREAYQQETGLIEIYQDGPEGLIEIPDTPDIDREALKKQWCLAYCEAHDYLVIENPSHHSDVQTQYVPSWHPSWLQETERFSGYS